MIHRYPWRQMAGTVLVQDFTESPCSYKLQQFQNRGHGTRVLKLILELLKKRTPPPSMYTKKAGFADSGYVDETLPDCVNLLNAFSTDSKKREDILPLLSTMKLA